MARRRRAVNRNRQHPSRAHRARSPDLRHDLGEDNAGFGFSAVHSLLAGVESVEQFQRFRESLLRDLAPDGAMQHMLVDRIVGNFWRLRRLAMLERELMDQNLGKSHAFMVHLGHGLLQRARDRGESVPLKPADNEDEQALRDMVTDYLRECFPRQAGWDRLRRYEAHLRKGIYDALGELRRLQGTRRAGRGRRADFG